MSKMEAVDNEAIDTPDLWSSNHDDWMSHGADPKKPIMLENDGVFPAMH